MKVSYAQLTELTGKAYRTLKNKMDAAGIQPAGVAEGPGGANLWESKEVLPALYAGTVSVDGDGRALDLNAERARLAKEQADKVELDNAERRKRLLPAESVESAWVTMITNAKTKLTGLPSKLAALSNDPEEGRRLFHESKSIVDEVLTELGRGR